MLAAAALIVIAAGLVYLAVPARPGALAVAVAAGLVGVFVAGQSGGSDPFTSLLPAVRAAR